ncbi:MAG: glycosyltransferase, partial [Armatimonadetes bacterium]|nr:glycosyltransferase [Armatimonadota bacterium]
ACEVGAGDFVLLYVGRIAREKNLEMLLRALKILAARRDNIKLLLVGGGPAFAETKQLARKRGLESYVRFLGMLRRDQIDPIYAEADIFVFPSATETQGIAICEAMSAGLPVVAVNAGGIPENIQDGVDG